MSSDRNELLDATLTPFFAPEGVVVVGASTAPAKLGHVLAQNLVRSGYGGAIHFVNPHGGTLFDRPLHPNLADVPGPVDLAVLLIPAPHIPETLRACGTRGIRAAIVASGGFRETGTNGEALEAECLQIAEAHGIRLIGPNCVGVLDTHAPLDTTFLPPPGPPPGDVAFVSHSGAICAIVIDWARGQGFGLSRLVSLGNQLDVTETDVLPSVAADPHTRVVTCYLEGLRDGRRFVDVAQQVNRTTPIVVLKVGRSEGGRQAAASHTGALAGQEVAYDAAFRRAGVLRARTTADLFDWARALAWCPLPARRRVAILTNAGGPGVAAADAASDHGLDLAALSAATRTGLKALLPDAASVHNPVDLLASASPKQYAESLRLLLDDPGVDSVLVILPPPPAYAAGAVARAMIPVIQTHEKPVVVALMGDRMVQEAAAYLRAARVPDYRYPETAASALGALARRAAWRRCPPEAPVRFSGVNRTVVQEVLRDTVPDGDGFLPLSDAARVLEAYGIPVADLTLARSADEAVAHARRLGTPVALKAAGLVHKSDRGGVALNLIGDDAVADGFGEIVRAVRNGDEAPPGVYVQPMVAAGQEVIIGVVRDAQFGPLVMFGAGGVEVEGRGDVAFALAPLTRSDADHLLDATWAGRKLRGFRHLPPTDRDAVTDVLLRIAHLADDVPQLTEVEINPLRVLPEGEGAIAVDARIRVGNAAMPARDDA
jgi:acetyltransferase